MSKLLFLSLCDDVNPFSAYKVYYLQNTYYTNKPMASSRNFLWLLGQPVDAFLVEELAALETGLWHYRGSRWQIVVESAAAEAFGSRCKLQFLLLRGVDTSLQTFLRWFLKQVAAHTNCRVKPEFQLMLPRFEPVLSLLRKRWFWGFNGEEALMPVLTLDKVEYKSKNNKNLHHSL